MSLRRPGSVLVISFAGLCLGGTVVDALEFEPGAGVAAEYTDNAKLSPDNTVSDLITVGYVGARLSEDTGPLKYDATTSFTNNSYTQDTFKDQRYFALTADTDWAMIKDRFDWFMKDYYSQRPINSLDANTPSNLQDSNNFIFGANIKFPLSARQNFSISPVFSQYYYETLSTDNKQLALSANWNYQWFRLTNVGLNLSTRNINYTEKNSLGNSIADTTFTNAAFVISGNRLRSKYSVNLGATNVKREGGGDTTGFTGNINWLADLTSRSKLNALLSTDLTDSSSVTQSVVQDPINGNPDDVQISTDVIRNSILNLAYIREDSSLKTRLWTGYRKVTYSESPSDRVVKNIGLQLNYPLTQLLSSGFYATYNHSDQLDTARLDKSYTIGSNLKYSFTRKWHSLFDLKYRTKDSTDAQQNYDEFSIYATLVYGFGEVHRPSRTGN